VAPLRPHGEPSRAPAIAQTFSVQNRSLRETVANVSTIWLLNVSSAATSGLIVGSDVT